MKIERTEIRTGLLVILTVAAFVAVLIYLGSPGVFVRQKTFHVYFDNASAMKPGTEVLLAGRKIGRVHRVFSPVPESERPTPKMEAMVEVEVVASASIYQHVKVLLSKPNMLGEPMIDFTNGEEASGLAPNGHSFVGERPGGLEDIVPTMLEKIDPVLQKATATLESLQKTSNNLSEITDEKADLPTAFAEFRKLGTNLSELSGPSGALHQSLENIKALTGDEGKLGQALDHLNTMTGPKSPLAKTLANAEHFTANLAENKDIEVTFRNFRQASERLNGTVEKLGPQLKVIGQNLVEASDTVKRQPWRLVWPSTKEYSKETSQPTPQPKRKTKR